MLEYINAKKLIPENSKNTIKSTKNLKKHHVSKKS